MIKINGTDCGSYGLNVEIVERAKTVKLTAYQWAGHQSSAAEGMIAKVRVVRPTVAACVDELKRRWLELVGQSKYVGFGGQFRTVAYYDRAEVLEAIDAIEEAIEEAGLTAA